MMLHIVRTSSFGQSPPGHYERRCRGHQSPTTVDIFVENLKPCESSARHMVLGLGCTKFKQLFF
jgi:hypothetical protein